MWPEPNMFFGGVHTVRRRADGRLVGVGATRRDGACVRGDTQAPIRRQRIESELDKLLMLTFTVAEAPGQTPPETEYR